MTNAQRRALGHGLNTQARDRRPELVNDTLSPSYWQRDTMLD
ncbi:MAG TPA: hypothetical protein VG125_08335 [Pirellulales bacterium]|nr:hypothetical protein [Pirellulales bacterium]